MTALNQVALQVQQHLDVDRLYRAACEALRRFGVLASVYLVAEDGWLHHVYTAMDDALLADYVQHFEGPIDFAVPLSALPGERIPTGGKVFDAQVIRDIMRNASLDTHPLVGWMLAHMRSGRMLMAALTQNDKAIGA